MFSSSQQTETFGAGTDEQNQARAEGFVKMVAAAGEDWPDGWVKGQASTGRQLTPTARPRSGGDCHGAGLLS